MATNTVFAYLNYMVLGRTVGMWSNNYGNLFYFLAGAFSGIAFIVCLTQLVYFPKLEEIGRNSIFYYGFHIIVLDVLDYGTRYIPGLSHDFVALIVSTMVVALTVIILKKIYPFYESKLYPKLAGRFDAMVS